MTTINDFDPATVPDRARACPRHGKRRQHIVTAVLIVYGALVAAWIIAAGIAVFA